MSATTSTDVPSITPPKPFKVEFDKTEVELLKHRLSTARLPNETLLPDGFKGPNGLYQLKPDLEWMKKSIDIWLKLDIDRLVEKLNRFDHFTTEIDWCKQLHFIHKRSSRSDAIPIILVHGWPGSFHEFTHVIEKLAEPEDPSAPAFHVVVPSLPGYLYSSPPPSNEPGVGDFVGYVRLLNALMRGLGYDRYASQGGDWGSPHARVLGALHAEKDGTGCQAVHLNFCPVSPSGLTKFLRSTLPSSALLSLAKMVYDQDTFNMIQKATHFEGQAAYYTVQKLRPAQLSYGLIDSPVGILGWLGFFFELATQGKPDHPTLNIPDLLETATLFHMTRSIGTSFLPYTINPYLPDIHADPAYRLAVPLAYSDFPDEIVNTSKTFVDRTTYNGTHWIAKATKGGHFAALEEPSVFVSHLRNAFSPKGKWAGHETDGIKTSKIVGGLWDHVREQQARSSGSKL